MKARHAQGSSANSYEKLWGELDTKMSRTSNQTQRGKLESLSLSWAGRVTMRDFELFDAEFRMIRSDQKFLSEREAAFLYAKKLPNFLLEKVEKERLRHSGQEFLFLRGLPGLTPHEVP